jgi:hypothetical protein
MSSSEEVTKGVFSTRMLAGRVHLDDSHWSPFRRTVLRRFFSVDMLPFLFFESTLLRDFRLVADCHSWAEDC